MTRQGRPAKAAAPFSLGARFSPAAADLESMARSSTSIKFSKNENLH
jgi:hypothetical protein